MTRDLISKTSNNINSTDYIIDHYSDDTYVIFSYEGFSDRLNISLTEITLESIVVEIYPKNLDAGQTLKFENILLIANAKEVEGNVETENTFTIKLDSSLLSATIDDTPLERNEEGFVIPSGLLGGKTIKFTYNSGVREYTAIIQVNISRQN